MFIYADESGHTGKQIFNEPPFYLQGAILSVEDTEPLFRPVANYYKKKLNVDRLHANEFPRHIVEEIALTFLDSIKKCNWQFHITIIEKPYLSITKFVDSIFDSFENKGVRWLWYNHQFFRHTLCCLFDEILPIEEKKRFWEAYLKDDHQGICCVVKYAINILDEISIDKRLKEVAKDGLSFALENPQEITLMANETKKSYKGHTPNMVAFISLLQSVHKFCKSNNVIPEVFIHDPQQEFGETMKKYHELISNVSIDEMGEGFLQPKRVEYGLGRFELKSSKDVASLQAVDVFLWLNQRNEEIEKVRLKKILMHHNNPFYISRAMSEMIIYEWSIKNTSEQLTKEQIVKGKEFIEKLEQNHLEELKKFKSQKLNDNESMKTTNPSAILPDHIKFTDGGSPSRNKGE